MTKIDRKIGGMTGMFQAGRISAKAQMQQKAGAFKKLIWCDQSTKCKNWGGVRGRIGTDEAAEDEGLLNL